MKTKSVFKPIFEILGVTAFVVIFQNFGQALETVSGKDLANLKFLSSVNASTPNDGAEVRNGEQKTSPIQNPGPILSQNMNQEPFLGNLFETSSLALSNTPYAYRTGLYTQRAQGRSHQKENEPQQLHQLAAKQVE